MNGDGGNVGMAGDRVAPARRHATETLISTSQWFVTVDQNPNARKAKAVSAAATPAGRTYYRGHRPLSR